MARAKKAKIRRLSLAEKARDLFTVWLIDADMKDYGLGKVSPRG